MKEKSLLDKFVNNINRDLGIKINRNQVIHEKNSNIVWLLSADEKKYILRERIKSGKFLRDFFYKVAFKSEIAMYHSLNRIDWKFFHHQN